VSTANLGKPVEVDVFTEQEALAFLAERTRRRDEDGAGELARELGYLPLALAQAAAVIAGQRLPYAVYLARLRDFTLADYLAQADSEPYPHGVAEAILLSIGAVTAADRTGLCGSLLRVMALLSPAGVSREFLYASGGTGIPSGQERAGFFRRARRKNITATPESIDESLGRLAGASLITLSGLDNGKVMAHRLVMRVAREQCIHDGSLAAFARSAYASLAAFKGLNDDDLRRDPVAAFDFFHQVAAVSDCCLPNPPGKDVALSVDVAGLLADAGEYILAAMSLQESLLRERVAAIFEELISSPKGRSPVPADLKGLLEEYLRITEDPGESPGADEPTVGR
jgi:hypothetical protein